MRSLILILIFSCLPVMLPVVTHAADETPRNKLVLGLDDCIRIALKSAPELGEAQADIEQTTSKLEEAKSYRYPQLEIKSLFGPAPGAKRSDLFATDKTFEFNELTWFASTDATLVQPLWTFGKISENMKAATHGIEVDRSRKEQRANEIVLKVKEYYFGLLLAREMKELVLEVQESLDKARNTAQKLLDQGSDSIDEMDIYKLDAFSGEVAKYLEEAKKGENLAMAALKTRLGLPAGSPLEISSERLTMDNETGSGIRTLCWKRPAPSGLNTDKSPKGSRPVPHWSRPPKPTTTPTFFWGACYPGPMPTTVTVSTTRISTDQFKHLNGGVALGLRWKLDFGITGAKVSGERAQYNRLLSTKEFADANIPLADQ